MEIEVQGIDIHFEVIGDGRPIVMLHGGGLDHRHMVAEMEPAFVRHPGWQRIYPDVPGHGATPSSERLTSQLDVLEVVLGFIDAVVGRRRFCIAGTSRGGYLARGVVHRRSADIDGALLIVPAGPIEGAEELDHVTIVEDPAVRAAVSPEEQDHFGLLVVQTEAALAELRRTYYPALAIRDTALRDRIIENYDFPFDVNIVDPPFTKPALIVTGAHDDVTGFREAWTMMEVFPRATFAVLDGAGHLLAVEHPTLLEALIDDWIVRVEAEVGAVGLA